MMVRPEIVREAHLMFLDSLRKSGQTDMFRAGPYVQETFGVDQDQAKQILIYWMDTFSDRHPS